ncbi:MAG: hypothetical protein HYY09_04635, partial [Firmicutes bacterium]|nr:hypothetical protein [Bacillota bacterium]
MSQGATGLATEKAPSLSLPVKYLVTAVFFFALFHTLLFIARDQLLFGHFVYPMLRAATHSATLGWLTMMIMGAMYQLVPVVLQESIFSETLGHWGFWSYAAGVSALIAGFAAGALPFLILGGSLAAVSIYIFIYNLARTLARVAEWNITGVYLSAALAYLFITVAAGMLLALNLQFGFLSNMGIGINFLAVHATAGGIGWFAMTAVGVGYKLVPMFALVHGHDERLG